MRIAWLLVLVSGLLLTSCYDESGVYSTVDDARAGAIFDRGLLPDILPPSTYDIHVTSNEDRSDGEFRFDPNDFSRFAIQFESFYQPFEYSIGGCTWIFICEPASGHCFYYVR